MGDSGSAGAYASAAGGIGQAYGAYKAGQYSKKVAQNNAHLAFIQAQQARETGRFNENRVAIHEAEVIGADRAAAASSGIVAGAGSNRNVIAANQAHSAMDQMMIELNARREAYGYKVHAAAATAEGRMAESAGNQKAASTLLNTGTRYWRQTDPNAPPANQYFD